MTTDKKESIGNVNNYQHDAYLERRLRDWGHWRIKYITGGLGYPSSSVEGRMRSDGGVLSKSTKAPEPPINLEAEEMDNLIGILGRYYPNCAEVINMHYASLTRFEFEAKRIHYEEKRIHFQPPTKEKLNAMPHGTYKVNLRLAKMWLIARITR